MSVRASHQHIFTGAPDQRIVTDAAEENIIVSTARDIIVAAPTAQLVITGVLRRVFIARRSGKNISSVTTVDLIVTSATV
ncbi:MAG: hypothetical protein R8G34_10885 [Paracoccaceae bacterium]|nr:hypothetical protein [Paracoccaceae bacterium]